MTLEPIDQDAFEAWVRTTYDLPPDVIALRTGYHEGAACVWVQTRDEDTYRCANEALAAPYPTMEALRAAFPFQPEEGQLVLAL